MLYFPETLEHEFDHSQNDWKTLHGTIKKLNKSKDYLWVIQRMSNISTARQKVNNVKAMLPPRECYI